MADLIDTEALGIPVETVVNDRLGWVPTAITRANVHVSVTTPPPVTLDLATARMLLKNVKKIQTQCRVIDRTLVHVRPLSQAAEDHIYDAQSRIEELAEEMRSTLDWNIPHRW